MYKIVKAFIWSIVGIIFLDANKHFITSKMFEYLAFSLIIALSINIIGIIYTNNKKSSYEKNKEK
ncbi:hypothetical protein [Flavobacterium panacis]|uniref:hypothetical protein n=1 Tax=Flavobacterium panacis TaxID=2962567 RepID=UPI001182CF3E|nr:hypothetical protein [Flavobacterium panacis]MCR4032994.1 hypothetical protein [Flavobacterium panacis]